LETLGVAASLLLTLGF